MKAYVAQQTKTGFSVKRMLHVERFPPKFSPTNCRTFQTFDEANAAAKFMSKRDKMPFVNMR